MLLSVYFRESTSRLCCRMVYSIEQDMVLGTCELCIVGGIFFFNYMCVVFSCKCSTNMSDGNNHFSMLNFTLYMDMSENFH